MTSFDNNRATTLLAHWIDGETRARDQLVELLYPAIRTMAAGMLRRQWSSPRYQPTELVNESFVKLLKSDTPLAQNRAHFLAIASKVMREVLVDHYRHYAADKRAHERVTLVTGLASEQELDFAGLADALADLEKVSPEFFQIVEMKYFGGMTYSEMGEVLNISEATVKRRWRAARAWLSSHMQAEV